MNLLKGKYLLISTDFSETLGLLTVHKDGEDFQKKLKKAIENNLPDEKLMYIDEVEEREDDLHFDVHTEDEDGYPYLRSYKFSLIEEI